MTDDLAINDPKRDPYTFIKAEEFFALKDQFVTPHSASLEKGVNDQDVTATGAMFRLSRKSQRDTLLLIQFIRPKVFRVRFDPSVESAKEYLDWNSRTIILDKLQFLVAALDKKEGLFWNVKLDEVVAGEPVNGVDPTKPPPAGKGTHYRLTSVVYDSEISKDKDTNGVVELCILVQKENHFRITAIRELRPTPSSVAGSSITNLATGYYFDKKLETRAAEKQWRIVWDTVDAPIAWRKFSETYATILTARKPGSARYIGFGEQGGRNFLKTSTYMNYFNYDNMQYKGVYGLGPLDEREPLYHSDPFWIELNTHQHMLSKVATFIDNLSQICIDFGDTNGGRIATGTRFGSMQYYVLAGDDIPDIIRLYTSLVGRPNLKPRYILGYHQGCYGYDRQGTVEWIVNEYKNRGWPLDGMHVDVDLQNGYRTFTINEGPLWPDPRKMFSELRKKGVRCSTNITPVISSRKLGNDGYKTLTEGLKKGYFIMDKRKTNGFWDDNSGGAQGWDVSAKDIRYISYEGGNRNRKDPHDDPPFDRDPNDVDYKFGDWYNSGNKPFHGGCTMPGYYPNLNNKKVREWWGKQYKDLFDAGLEFVWQDMTGPCMAVNYGDMKSFPFRLLVPSDAWHGQKESPAITIWHLYSYNLHKATYHGLNNLKSREGKRNFIIGRGSFAGMYRYAGLWTGDNGSTWDHFRISVTQVLAAGLCGVSISGADVGGFEKEFDQQLWANPELITRWYCAYFMLPWFRCHYMGKPGHKKFQEPWRYTDLWNHPEDQSRAPQDEEYLYMSVEKICKYYTKLRYTLLQLLYDAMFENVINGLPIARALIVTDTLDEGLFTDFTDFLSNEYVVRNDLLIAPIMDPQCDDRGHTADYFENGQWHKPIRLNGKRKVYLPEPNKWYPFNLRVNFDPTVDGRAGAKLEQACDGGSTIRWDGSINWKTRHDNEEDPKQLPLVTPMYVREGGIIPQIGFRKQVPTKEENDVNPITIHVYPGGGHSVYQMYHDDGENILHTEDPQAANKFREVIIKQNWAKDPARIVEIVDGKIGDYPWDEVTKRIGEKYTLVLWHANDVDISTVQVEVADAYKQAVTPRIDKASWATILAVPVKRDKPFSVKVTWKYTLQK
ncbi:glycosyl hydrolases family 31-domain-containing protein [Kalaharituber pfeilii]|nr:glycosyl hydrolases family 31-domain-containing protein [Kalaharituber pfeilii]